MSTPKKNLFLHYNKKLNQIEEPVKLNGAVAGTLTLPVTTTAGSALANQVVNYTAAFDQNNVITLQLNSLTGNATAAANIVTSAIFTSLIPSATRRGLIRVIDNNIDTVGTWAISNTGVLTIGAGTDETVAFTNGQPCGWELGTITYIK